MKKGLVIADAGPIFSLAFINKLEILDALFSNVLIPVAVWKEITLDKTTGQYERIATFFQDKVRQISGFNELTFVMDYGESESVILYKEMEADFLLIDDKKARKIAENFGINCIGTLGLLSIAKSNGMISELKPLFEQLIKNKRYYSIDILNRILKKHNGDKLSNKS